ncbi:MAG: hypothetical protein WB531_01700 [Thermoplasmata archaeon]
MTIAIVVMVVVIVIVGGAGYAALSAVSGSGTKSITTCSPPASPICQTTSGLNDVVLTVPYGAGFGQAVYQSQQGANLPATVAVSGGEAVTSYKVLWGDGTNSSGANPTMTHTYSSLGWFVVSGQALVGSTWHSGPTYLYPIEITPSYDTTSSGFYPTLDTTFTNGSTAATQFGWFAAPGSVTVSATYTANSTATGYTDHAPTLASTGGTQSNLVSTATSVSASYAFSTAGLFYITMVGAVTAPTGIVYQNFTWTVYVAPTGIAPGCRSCSSLGLNAKSPHTGQLIFQTVAPGGATSEDPAVAYDSTSFDPILNVYQTLVAYNGSSTASFLPELSMCVPGPGCAAMYGGNPLIVDNATTGAPEYWTFPIDAAARFYDPSTGTDWPVYPSDVAFSFARSCGFSDLPGSGAQPGWIQCQALLANGNAAWDAGIHAPYNNTPQGILSSILINESTYCPVAVMAHSNGCVTFNAWGGGGPWSFFLELVEDPLGAGIEPCGWFSAQNAGVPGFVTPALKSGDAPCLIPGGAKSTLDSTFQNWLKTTPATYWDSFEELALNAPGIQPGVRWNMVGSGPYYLTHQPFEQSVGYTLSQNPYYQAPTGCAGQPNCEPLPGPSHYVANVTVVYQASDTIGIEQYASGLADFATILPTEVTQMLSLIQEGKIGALTSPTLTIYFLAIAMEFDPAATRMVDPEPLNIPGDFFNYVGLREFLVNAFPYNTVETTISTTDGIQYGVVYGGAIPLGMGNYYPANISWPTSDPVSSPSVSGSAAWWWAQATNSSSPYYDPELTSCTTSSPCKFPLVGADWYPQGDQMLQDYMPYISALSDGRLEPNTFDLTSPQDFIWGISVLPGQSAMPMAVQAWGADYPDPSDFMSPTYYPSGFYTTGNGVDQGLGQFICSSATGAPTGMPADSDSMAGLLFWAHQVGIPQACQGNAYSAMVLGMNLAAGMAVGPARVLMYNLVEHIAKGLALYVYIDQATNVFTYAAWINPTTINTNPVVGANGVLPWYSINGNGVLNA